MIDADMLIGFALCGNTNTSCIDLNAYQYASPTIPDKEWAVAVQGTPQSLKSIYGEYSRYVNVTMKDRFIHYQIAHDKWTLQASPARSLELERECYTHATTFLIHARRRRFQSLSTILTFLREATKQRRKPNQKFSPSQQLVGLVYRHMLRPENGEIVSLLSELSNISTGTTDEKIIVKDMITDQVESLLTNLAKRASYSNEEKIEVARNNRFTPEVCSALVDRLGLDIYVAPSVLKLLYDELLSFLSLTHRERIWGKIFAENSTIKLEVKKDTFALPKFPSIDDRRWSIT